MSIATRRGVRQMLAAPSQIPRPKAYTLTQVKTHHYGYDESMLADGWTPYHNPPIDT